MLLFADDAGDGSAGVGTDRRSQRRKASARNCAPAWRFVSAAVSSGNSPAEQSQSDMAVCRSRRSPARRGQVKSSCRMSSPAVTAQSSAVGTRSRWRWRSGVALKWASIRDQEFRRTCPPDDEGRSGERRCRGRRLLERRALICSPPARTFARHATRNSGGAGQELCANQRGQSGVSDRTWSKPFISRLHRVKRASAFGHARCRQASLPCSGLHQQRKARAARRVARTASSEALGAAVQIWGGAEAQEGACVVPLNIICLSPESQRAGGGG